MTEDDVNIDRAVMILEDRVWDGDDEQARRDALEHLDAVPKSALRDLCEKYQERYEKAQSAGFTAEYTMIEEFLEDLNEVIDDA
ncbi:hypothetical protein DEQ92_20300 [Haloferax sp. Atlit-6N]|uniref:hypothetical protein n=1 Tax=Haloferax sp. Atlit-6N TaxID=2077205 RepID=UPI000E259881|nr:hypothetical protein [Haloferax sp. Atlit-6N]REA00197.1 hypothetical protein DEQ92_20300 [Haloferax sp. Atlit-6N]